MKKNYNYFWRFTLFLACVSGGFLLLLVRLADVQIVKGNSFLNQANDNRFFSIRTPAERGIIYDRYQQPLTYNVPRYYHLTNPENIYSERRVISTSEAMQLKATDSAHLTYELERDTVFGAALSHIIGYTGLVSADDLLKDSTLFAADRVGKLGLEKQFDTFLRGSSGSDTYEINALGQRQRLIESKPGKPGQSIQTTIDPYISQIAYKALGTHKGAVVILDADTSEIITITSAPSYEPRLLSRREVDPEKEKERKSIVQGLFDSTDKVFFNRAISGAYPPGSVFKLITGLIGLEENAFDSQTTVEDEGILKVGEYTYANWFYTQYGGRDGTINLQRSIARSNDIFFYKAAEWLGPQKLADGARLFGLGSKTGIDIAGEASGLVPDPKWKEEVVGEKWFLGNTYHFGIGQADLLVTPLQVAQYTQALADMGTMCQPFLVKQPLALGTTLPACKEIGAHEDNLQIIIKGMLDACSDGGTAFPFFEHNRSNRPAGEKNAYAELKAGAIACKTGTAEFGGVDEKGYRKTHGWFTAILDTEKIVQEASTSAVAPVATDSAVLAQTQIDDRDLYQKWKEQIQQDGFPKRLVIVAMVESDEQNPYQEGSKDAGPIVRKIVDWMQGKDISVVGVGEGVGE